MLPAMTRARMVMSISKGSLKIRRENERRGTDESVVC
mgnify:CR=1 FL=1